MIEAYSNNLSAATNEAISFNSISLKKGCTVSSSGTVIQFNRPGVYELSVNATATVPSAQSSAPADATIQLYKKGAAEPQAFSSVTAVSETDKQALSFTTLVRIQPSGCCEKCSVPETCTVINTGAPVNFENINLVVTKLV